MEPAHTCLPRERARLSDHTEAVWSVGPNAPGGGSEEDDEEKGGRKEEEEEEEEQRKE